MASTPQIKNAEKQQLLLDARLKAQHLGTHDVYDLQELVRKMGALQAQHFEMAQWAIGRRLGCCTKMPDISSALIQKAFEQGKIVRTHALRPTWQLLAGEDLLWILQLTAPAIKKALFGRDKHLGIEQKEYARADAAIYRILSDQLYLTKQELVSQLGEDGFMMDEYRSNHYIMHAELEGIICSGAVKNEKHRYGLVENVLGKDMDKALLLKKELQGAAGVKELAGRYFSTRGPASVADFAWWSGLGITEIKKALLSFTDQLMRWEPGDFKEGGRPSGVTAIKNSDLYYLPALAPESKMKGRAAGVVSSPKSEGRVQLLAAFDEYLISYKDRSAMLAPELNRQIITINGMFRPAVVRGGKIVAGWQVEKAAAAKSDAKTGNKAGNGLKIKILPFASLKPTETKALLKEIEPEAALFARFKNMPILSLKSE